MTKKINSKKDLPKEFSLEKYNSLAIMSDKDFFRQLYWRMFFNDPDWTEGAYFIQNGSDSKMPSDSTDPFNEFVSKHPDEFYEQFNGNKEAFERFAVNSNNSLRISSGDGVRGLSRLDVVALSKATDTHGERSGKKLVIDIEEFNFSFMEPGGESHGWISARASDSINKIIDNELCLVVDLNLPDEILIDDLKNLLPMWRKELNVKEVPIEINNSWNIVRRKILEYKIIPYMDLISWSLEQELIIAQGVLAVSLFPDGEKDVFAIVQTVRPFIEKLVSEGSLEKLRREISK